jgi:hypothetical protein
MPSNYASIEFIGLEKHTIDDGSMAGPYFTCPQIRAIGYRVEKRGSIVVCYRQA